VRDRNTQAKRQRETQQRQKAEEKRARRQKKKELTPGAADAGYDPLPANAQAYHDRVSP
jgi:hypothetical protein